MQWIRSVTKKQMRFGVKMLATEEQFLIRIGERYPLKMNVQNTENKIPLANKILKNFGSMVIRKFIYFFILSEGPVMISNCVQITREFKAVFLENTSDQIGSPQNLQSLCSLCHPWFSKNPISKISKVSGFRSPQREMPKTQNFLKEFDLDATDYGIKI